MNNAKIAITSLLSLAIVGQVNAQTPFVYDGSDTLGPIVEELLKDPACGSINYLENGSGAGQTAMLEGKQQTAPMSSNLSSEVCADPAYPKARQAAVAVDKLLVVRNNKGAGATCDTDMVRDVPGYSSTKAPAWAEALQLIYGGKDGAGDTAACSDSARADLINNWGNIWENDCDGGSCTKLRFAFRRGDRSGTTKVFRKLTGISAYCNGAQHEDKDTLRTDCSLYFETGGAEYCPNGDLGVVQAIDVPKTLPNTARPPCAEGNFEYGTYTAGDCPDQTAPFAGFLCVFPRDCNDGFGCANAGPNTSPLNPFVDGRAYNYLHLTPGLFEPYVLPVDVDDDGKETKYDFRSLYFNGKCSGGETGANATLLIGCLVDAVDCSIGFGGRSMLDAPSTIATPGDTCNTTTAVPNVAARFDGIGEESSDYRLSRNLYFNTLTLDTVDGKFDCSSITDANEQALCNCMFDADKVASAVSEAGFVPLTDGPTVVACGG